MPGRRVQGGQSTRVDSGERTGLEGEEPGFGPTGSAPRQPVHARGQVEDLKHSTTKVPNNRGTRVVTREEYQRAWEAYSNEPSAAAVARALGCGQDVAQRLVHEGLPVLGLPPLDKRLKVEARAAAAGDAKLSKGTEKLTAEGAARELERRKEALAKVEKQSAELLGDAGTQKMEEARLVRANRIGATALAGINAKLLRTASRLADHLDEALGEAEKEKKTGKAALEHLGLKPSGALELVKSIATVSVRVAQSSEAAVRMERLLMGEPTDILGVQGGEERKHMSQAEAEKVFSEAARAFARAKQRQQAVDAEVEEEGHA